MALATTSTTRERLVAAAIEVFRRDGYERARVQDIARAAGLTTGAIYANFRDKAELLLAAIAQSSSAEVETLLQAGATGHSRDALAELGSRMVFREHDRPLLLDAVVAARRDPALAEHLRELLAQRHDRFADLVELGKTERAIDPALDTDALTRFCLTLALGSLVVRTLALPQPDSDQWDAIVGRLLDALPPDQETT